MSNTKQYTQEEVDYFYQYVRTYMDVDTNPSTPLNKENRANNARKGKMFGFYNRRPRSNFIETIAHVRIGFKGERYIFKVSRLVWLYHYGCFPKEHIDHIDCNTLNNDIKNLREVTNNQNQLNKRAMRGGTSKYKGVYIEKHKENIKYCGRFKFKDKQYGKNFKTEIEAAVWYDLKSIETHGIDNPYLRLNFTKEERQFHMDSFKTKNSPLAHCIKR